MLFFHQEGIFCVRFTTILIILHIIFPDNIWFLNLVCGYTTFRRTTLRLPRHFVEKAFCRMPTSSKQVFVKYFRRNIICSPGSMPIQVLQCMFHIEKLFCTHRFFHNYAQTRTEKFTRALLLILMREVYTKIDYVV